MDNKKFQELYGLTEQDKQDIIDRVSDLSQDVSWLDDELIDEERQDFGIIRDNGRYKSKNQSK